MPHCTLFIATDIRLSKHSTSLDKLLAFCNQLYYMHLERKKKTLAEANVFTHFAFLFRGLDPIVSISNRVLEPHDPIEAIITYQIASRFLAYVNSMRYRSSVYIALNPRHFLDW